MLSGATLKERSKLMARRNNFLLGRGEELTRSVSVPTNGGPKKAPYTFFAARQRLAPRLLDTAKEFNALPPAARPKDQVVAMVTMHPRYTSKSDFPDRFFDAFGLRAVGSRVRRIRPEHWGVQSPPEDALTNDIFVAGAVNAFGDLARTLPGISDSVRWAGDLTHIEDVSAFTADAKLRPIDDATRGIGDLYEVVIHNSHDRDIVRRFLSYARLLQAEPLEEWRRDVGGLTFLPVRATPPLIRAIAEFSFVRVARVMPRLRVFRPDIVRLTTASILQLPDEPAVDVTSRVVVFDGGLPDDADLSSWVTLIEPNGIGAPDPDLQEHGLAVTSALLFGNLSPERLPPGQPLCHIDHVRVMDLDTANRDMEYFQVLDRIIDHLERNRGQYQFVGLSLGPRHSIADDDVTQWTARLDECLATGATLAVVAAGNDGELSPEAGLNRIQPPADGVNVLSVGACDSENEPWRRAVYSCIGPGRAPGLVKPDGVAFGGTPTRPYFVLSSRPQSYAAVGVNGTSVAAPHALRSAIAVRAQLGSELTPLAIRALLIHCAEETNDSDRREVGWGRFKSDYSALITCEDHEALIVYQGVLPVEYHLRAPIPLPKLPLEGMVEIAATFLIPTGVDPEHAGAYTRSGVRVSFRPDSRNFRRYEDGSRSKHPITESFFSVHNMYAAAEYELQERGQKWEPCIRASRKKRAAGLHEPCFDIDYQHRDGPQKAREPQAVNYALIISVRAPRVPDLYNQIVRDYAKILVPIRPRIRIPVRG